MCPFVKIMMVKIRFVFFFLAKIRMGKDDD